MRKVKKVIWNKKYWIIILLLSLFFFSYKGIFGFLLTENLAGHDLIGNFAFTWLMKGFIENLSVSGWSNLWFSGFPIYDFYPPLFFIIVNLLNFLTLNIISLEMSYKLIIFTSLFLFPFTIFYSFKRIGFKSIEAFFVSVFSFAFLFLNGHYAAVHQTLNFGLVAQMFALNLLILFFGEIHKKRNLIAGILLGLLILSHSFISLIGIIGLLIFLILNKEKYRKTIIIGIFGLIISSWWLLNILINIQYMNIYTSNIIPISDFPLIFIPFIIASFKKEKKVLFLLALFLITLFLGTVGLSIPTQYARFFQYSLLFGMILSGLGAYRIYEFIKNSFLKTSTQKLFLIFIILIPLLFNVFQEPVYQQWKSDLDTKDLFNYIKTLGDGRIIVEGSPVKESYVLTEKIPIETGKEVLNELHVDSSISAPYTLALNYWVIGSFTNPICNLCKSDIKIEPELLLKNLEKFNVKYIITKHDLGLFKLKEKIGKYKVYENPFDSQYYEIPKYKPILIVSSLNDWKKLNEKIFIDKDLTNLTFVWSDKIENNNFITFVKGNESVDEFYKKMKSENLIFEENYNASIENFKYSNKEISFKLNSEKEIPIILKFSYYPKWKSNKKIYLTNPSLMLVFGKGEIKLNYE